MPETRTMKKRIPLEKAEAVAERFIGAVRDVCDCVAVAGSVRRRKPTVGDIEIVCLAKRQLDLLGQPRESLLAPRLSRLQEDGTLAIEKGGDRYKKVIFEDCPVDLFITTPECWGVILTIRTGPAEFSRDVVTRIGRGGYLPDDCRVQDGRVRRGGELLETPEERDFLELCGLGWIEPEKRKAR